MAHRSCLLRHSAPIESNPDAVAQAHLALPTIVFVEPFPPACADVFSKCSHCRFGLLSCHRVEDLLVVALNALERNSVVTFATNCEYSDQEACVADDFLKPGVASHAYQQRVKTEVTRNESRHSSRVQRIAVSSFELAP